MSSFDSRSGTEEQKEKSSGQGISLKVDPKKFKKYRQKFKRSLKTEKDYKELEALEADRGSRQFSGVSDDEQIDSLSRQLDQMKFQKEETQDFDLIHNRRFGEHGPWSEKRAQAITEVKSAQDRLNAERYQILKEHAEGKHTADEGTLRGLITRNPQMAADAILEAIRGNDSFKDSAEIVKTHLYQIVQDTLRLQQKIAALQRGESSSEGFTEKDSQTLQANIQTLMSPATQIAEEIIIRREEVSKRLGKLFMPSSPEPIEPLFDSPGSDASETKEATPEGLQSTEGKPLENSSGPMVSNDNGENNPTDETTAPPSNLDSTMPLFSDPSDFGIAHNHPLRTLAESYANILAEEAIYSPDEAVRERNLNVLSYSTAEFLRAVVGTYGIKTAIQYYSLDKDNKALETLIKTKLASLPEERAIEILTKSPSQIEAYCLRHWPTETNIALARKPEDVLYDVLKKYSELAEAQKIIIAIAGGQSASELLNPASTTETKMEVVQDNLGGSEQKFTGGERIPGGVIYEMAYDYLQTGQHDKSKVNFFRELLGINLAGMQIDMVLGDQAPFKEGTTLLINDDSLKQLKENQEFKKIALESRNNQVKPLLLDLEAQIKSLKERLDKIPNYGQQAQPKIDFLRQVVTNIQQQYIQNGTRPEIPPISKEVSQKIGMNWFKKIVAAVSNFCSAITGKSQTAKLADKVQSWATATPFLAAHPPAADQGTSADRSRSSSMWSQSSQGGVREEKGGRPYPESHTPS